MLLLSDESAVILERDVATVLIVYFHFLEVKHLALTRAYTNEFLISNRPLAEGAQLYRPRRPPATTAARCACLLFAISDFLELKPRRDFSVLHKLRMESPLPSRALPADPSHLYAHRVSELAERARPRALLHRLEFQSPAVTIKRWPSG